MEFLTKDPHILIEQLLYFAEKNQIINSLDKIYIRNQLIYALRLDQPLLALAEIDSLEPSPTTPTVILESLLDYAWENGILKDNSLTSRDLFDTLIMGILMPKPSELNSRFKDIMIKDGIEKATSFFYEICQKCDYIRVNRIEKNIEWPYNTEYGFLDITINLTKPEKDPVEIAALKDAPSIDYPKCLLCKENVGYAGRVNFPARQTLRILPLELNNESWYFQFSPYVYYNHHCIVFSDNHVPMKISDLTFIRLFDFVKQFPHYFIGSNAGLPIVGGSILNHDHFQGGCHKMPMAKAPIEFSLFSEDFPDLTIGKIKWPMAALRIKSTKLNNLIAFCQFVFKHWEKYEDVSVDIKAFSLSENNNYTPHNAITPIARMTKEDAYEIDIVFRNNRTSEEYPFGIFHPHEELHHIKKENIGLIEVMGLFILPGRLQEELRQIKTILTGKLDASTLHIIKEENPLHKHLEWISSLINSFGVANTEKQADEIIQNAIGNICLQVLHHASVFKDSPTGNAALLKFLSQINIVPKN